MSSALPAWEDLFLYSLSVECRKRFETAVHNAKTQRRKKSQSIGDEFIFFQGNKPALPRQEFVEFFRAILILRYLYEMKNEKARKQEQQKGSSSSSSSASRPSFLSSSALTGATASSSSLAVQQQLDPDMQDMEAIYKDRALSGVLNSVDAFLNIFFAAADAERSGRVDWDRSVQLVEDIIAAGGIVRLVGGQSVANSMARGGDGTVDLAASAAAAAAAIVVTAASDSKRATANKNNSSGIFQQMQASSAAMMSASSAMFPPPAAQQRSGIFNNTNMENAASSSTSFLSPPASGAALLSRQEQQQQQQLQQQQSTMMMNTFAEESKAAAEHESTVGVACASMRVLRIMRFTGERLQSVQPSAARQLELLKSRLLEAEKHAALASRRSDFVQTITARYGGAPPTRGAMGGNILPPPPMFRSTALQLRAPLCNMNQARVLLDTAFEPSRTTACAVHSVAAAQVTRLQYEPSVGMFTAICKETNEVRFLGESHAFLQRLGMQDGSKVESVTLWPTVAASKALARGAGTIFESCAYSCFAGLLDGTVQLWSLRDTRIGPGMRNVTLKLQTQLPSGYVCCSMHVPYAKPSSVLTGTSTGDLIHWNFDPHVVEDFMGGSDVSWVQAAAYSKLMVSRRVRLHEGRLMELCVLGDVGVRDMTIFTHDEDDLRETQSARDSKDISANDNNNYNNNNNKNNNRSDGQKNNKKGSNDGGTLASAAVAVSSAGGSGSGSSGSKVKHIPINVVSVGWDGYAVVTDIAAPHSSAAGGGGGSSNNNSSSASGVRRFHHKAGLLTCCAASESVFAAAGFVTEPHLWDIRAGSATVPVMKLYDKRSPHCASITSLSVMSHLMPVQLASIFKRKTSAQVSGGGSASAALLPPLVSCDSVGKINVWDLRVGRTLAEFDIHTLVDEACDSLIDEKEKKRQKVLRRAAGSVSGSNSVGGDDYANSSAFSITESKYFDDSCKAVLSRRTGRMFVSTANRSSLCEFGSVTDVDQDPRGVFPSEAVIAVAFVSSQHMVITAHADAIVLWDISRRNGGSSSSSFSSAATTQPQSSTQSSTQSYASSSSLEHQKDDGSTHIDDDQKRDGNSLGVSPFCVAEVHEFVASDIDAAAASAARDKVLFRDRNSSRPPILTQLNRNERIVSFTLHSRGHQYAIGTNQGRVFVARVNGGEVVFRTERSIFPNMSSNNINNNNSVEVRCLASASAPHLYCDRLTSFSSLLGKDEKTLLQDDTIIAVGSDERVFCVHSLRMQVVQIYPKGSPAQCQVSRHDVLSVMCGDAPYFFCCDPLQTASLPAFPHPSHRHADVTHRMTAMTVAPWLDVAFLGDSRGRLHCVATKPHALADAGKASHLFSAGFHEDKKEQSDSDDSDDEDIDLEKLGIPAGGAGGAASATTVFSSTDKSSSGNNNNNKVEDSLLNRADNHWHRLKLKQKERMERRKRRQRRNEFRAFGADGVNDDDDDDDTKSSNAGDMNEKNSSQGEEETNDATPSISAIAAHHVGSATFQEFTLIVAGTDTGRLGWWRVRGEMEELAEEVFLETERRRRSSQLGLTAVDANNDSCADFGSFAVHGGGKVDRTASSSTIVPGGIGATHSSSVLAGSTLSRSGAGAGVAASSSCESQSAFGAKGPQGSVAFAASVRSGHPKRFFYVKPTVTWLASCNYHDGARIESIAIFPLTRRETMETSALDSIWIAAAASDGRVSLVRAATGEFVALVSAGPAARLGDIAATIAATQEQQRQLETKMLREQQQHEQQQLREREEAAAAKAREEAAGSASARSASTVAQDKKQQHQQQRKRRSGEEGEHDDDRSKKTAPAVASAASSIRGGLPANDMAASFMKSPAAAATAAAAAAAAASASSGDYLLSPAQKAAKERRQREEQQQRDAKAAARQLRDFSLPALFFIRRFIRNAKVAVARRRKQQREENKRKLLDASRASASAFVLGIGSLVDNNMYDDDDDADAFGATMLSPGAGAGAGLQRRESLSGPPSSSILNRRRNSGSALTGRSSSFRKHQQQQQQQETEGIPKQPLPEEQPSLSQQQEQQQPSSSANISCSHVLSDVQSQHQPPPPPKKRANRKVQIVDDHYDDDAFGATMMLTQRGAGAADGRDPGIAMSNRSRRLSLAGTSCSTSITPEVSPALVRPSASIVFSSSGGGSPGSRGSRERDRSISSGGGVGGLVASMSSISGVHWGQTMMLHSQSSMVVPSLSEKKTAIAWSEMPARHARYAAKTCRASVPLAKQHHHHQEQQQQHHLSMNEDQSAETVTSRNNANNNPSSSSTSPSRSRSNSPLWTASTAMESRGSSSSRPNSASATRNTAIDEASMFSQQQLSAPAPPTLTGPLLAGPVQLGGMETEVMSPPHRAEHAAALLFANEPDLGFEKDCRTRADPRLVIDTSRGASTTQRPMRPGSARQQPVVVRDRDGNDVSDSHRRDSMARMCQQRQQQEHEQQPANSSGGFHHSFTPTVPTTARPASASLVGTRPLQLARDDVEKTLRDVTASRFLLPESRARVSKRFAQSVVVSAGTRSIVPVNATIITRYVATHGGSSSSSGVAATDQQQHQKRPSSSARSGASSSAATAAFSGGLLALDSPRASATPTSEVLTSNTATATKRRQQQQQQQQKHDTNAAGIILNDPDSDMSSKILPPSGSEVSARQAADVLLHTSARTNELVKRKVAVEHEAERFRFRYDVDSRQRRQVLMSRVGRMSGCIDAALTPASIMSIGALGDRTEGSATAKTATTTDSARSTNRQPHHASAAAAAMAAASASASVAAAAGRKRDHQQHQQQYVVTPALLQWCAMDAPMSAAQPK